MIRTGLFLYLMLALAAGPGLCCCLPERFVAKNTQKNSCCQNNDFGKKDAPAKTPSAPCPCQEDRLAANIVLSMEQVDVLRIAENQVSSMFDIPPMQHLQVDRNIVDNSPGNLAFAHLSARGILRAIHLLRC